MGSAASISLAGQVTATALADAGAAVGVVARSADEIAATAARIQDRGGRAEAITVDVVDEQSVRRAFERIRGDLGEIDLLVNNAGRNTTFGPVWRVDADRWWGDVAVNLLGPFLCSAAVLPSMVGRGQGRIVNVVSGTAGRPFPYNSGYAASKAAAVRLTDCLAAETAGYGVHVFALEPGSVRIGMSADISKNPEAARWLGPVLGRALETLPDVPASATGAAVVFLASGRADALSGRWVDAADDLAEIARRTDEVADADLFQLRRRKRPGHPLPG
ncbi:SDR family NAD(P)-dependent oxidoreductase [Actinopolymorpha pittospori]|uniref:NAD(P)-dependent dehydrogenase (Short-subunit alcohol dehydrogenase family) n=1 Tax=Actinopolymorpha pittospori TaxID=648752 RepID=A0A927MWF2_9ACTN|nr:SDR family NAD(P)-dependent oxidoreductase [Actinopolymorpha pittospori]MBE1606013.1 NAD(P)-dependent dehydrogenase (short-subunit alcohol dehydrogenase family) [Actinopolymorpha pittospori]